MRDSFQYKSHSLVIFEWLTILRGIASLGVVLYHSRVDLWVGWNEIVTSPEKYTTFVKSTSWLSIPMPFLGKGVMLFFLISGFSIHYSNIGRNHIDFKSYFSKRFIRIYPPYLTALIVSYFISLFFLSPNEVEGNVFFRSIFMIQNYPPFSRQISSNPSLWSLPVEMEFYIAYPFVFYLLKRIDTIRGLIFVSLISLFSIILGIYKYHWLEMHSSTYWILWVLGAVLAIKVKKFRIKTKTNCANIIIGFIFIVIGIIFVLKHFPSNITDIIWGIGFYFLIQELLKCPFPNTFDKNILIKLFLYLGNISFSLYLVHFPLFKLISIFWIAEFSEKPTNILICLIFSFLTIPISVLFYNFIEKPSHNLAKNIESKFL